MEGGEFPGTSNSLLSGAVIAWRARRAGNKGDLVLCWVGRHVLFLKKKKKEKKGGLEFRNKDGCVRYTAKLLELVIRTV